jgi:hypothetical protein
MPLPVHVCCSYTPSKTTRSPDHWAALHFVKAIKGTPIDGHADIPLSPRVSARLTPSCAHLAPHWFARMAVAGIDWTALAPCAFVPIPDASCDLAATRPPKTHRLAGALSAVLRSRGAEMFDVLRWSRPMAPAHCADGTRDPQVLYGRLCLKERRLVKELPLALEDRRVVLVDDVIATGGHMRAAAAYLVDCGADVPAAVCVAHATYDDQDLSAPFKLRTIVLPDFQSDPDWLLPEVYDGVQL